ncbi:hypothetical protein M9H77_11843 [Catharanthus roseus]|uniref:Uncharacterized protein n=1 Tax=Catharanthus roseus TaxID=4058 RepID=A0ACC0BFN1_CATRO|nr:hypothetical protein M9H77_11843 [Catharanthus roseus]
MAGALGLYLTQENWFREHSARLARQFQGVARDVQELKQARIVPQWSKELEITLVVIILLTIKDLLIIFLLIDIMICRFKILIHFMKVDQGRPQVRVGRRGGLGGRGYHISQEEFPRHEAWHEDNLYEDYGENPNIAQAYHGCYYGNQQKDKAIEKIKWKMLRFKGEIKVIEEFKNVFPEEMPSGIPPWIVVYTFLVHCFGELEDLETPQESIEVSLRELEMLLVAYTSHVNMFGKLCAISLSGNLYLLVPCMFNCLTPCVPLENQLMPNVFEHLSSHSFVNHLIPTEAKHDLLCFEHENLHDDSFLEPKVDESSSARAIFDVFHSRIEGKPIKNNDYVLTFFATFMKDLD